MIPAGTDYLALCLMAIEDVMNDLGHPEFDGHYFDDVSLDLVVVPEPSAVAMLGGGLACLGLVGRTWRISRDARKRSSAA